MTERFMIDDAGTLIDIETRNTFDYVSDVCSLLNTFYEENQEYKQKVKETLQKRYTHLQKIKQEIEKPPRYWQGAIMEIKVVADCLGVDLE